MSPTAPLAVASRVVVVVAMMLVWAGQASAQPKLDLVGLQQAEAVAGDAVPEGLRPANEDDPKADNGAIVREDGYSINWISLTNSADIDVKNGATSASINLHGQLQIPLERNPAAYIIEINDVVDTRGRSLMNRRLNRWSGQSQQWPVQRISQRSRNQSQWSLATNLSGLVGWSTSIDRVSGVVWLLEVTETRDIDLPLTPGKKFTELAGDVSIKVKKVERQSNSLTVRYAISAPNPQALEDLAEPPFLWRQSLLDDAGEEIPVGPSYSNRSGTNEGYLRFYMQNAESGPASVRFTLATAAVERKIPFELRDLRMNPADAPAKPDADPDADDAADKPDAPAKPDKPAKPDGPEADTDEGDPAPPANNPTPKPPVRNGIDGGVFK